VLEFDDCDDAWVGCNPADRWIFNKLELSTRLGYTCGPAGVDTPSPGSYIVRPCINLLGMGRNAEFMEIEEDTDHLPPGTFWCEIFEGNQYTVDFVEGKQANCLQAFRAKENPLYKFDKWQVVDKTFQYPQILHTLVGEYKTINVEFIEDKIIEVHLRGNPDLKHKREVFYPVWDENVKIPEGFMFVEDNYYKRKGFIVKNETNT